MLVDAVDAQVDQLIERQVSHAFGSQSLNVLRRDAVDAKRNKLIGRRVLETQVADLADKLGRHAVNAKRDQFLRVGGFEPGGA